MNPFHYLNIDVTKPVCFLDLCGVLGDTWIIREGDRIYDFSNDFIVNPEAPASGDVMYKPMVDAIVKIFRKHDVQIVMVSSWVKSYQDANHSDITLIKKMLGYDLILGSIYTGGGASRGEKVLSCVDNWGLNKWLVIDDSKEVMYTNPRFNSSPFIHPHGRYGVGIKELESLHHILTAFNKKGNN